MENESNNIINTSDSNATTEESGTSEEYNEPQQIDFDTDSYISSSVGDSEVLPNEETNLEIETDIEVDSETLTEVTNETDLSGVYSELEYIDYLLIEQNEILQSTVSGNSVSVKIDDSVLEDLTAVSDNQQFIINNQSFLIGLVGCVLMAVCIEWLFASAKRSIKWLTGRKE